MKSLTDLLLDAIAQNGSMTTGQIADVLGISSRRAGMVAAKACDARKLVRMVRACRGREAMFGPPASADHETTIRDRVERTISDSPSMLSANAVALAIGAKRDTVAHHLIDLAARGVVLEFRRGRYTFYGRDDHVSEPTIARRPAAPKAAPQPHPKPRLIKRQPPAPAPVIPVSSASGSIRYGGYIGAAPARAPWLDFTGWPESSAPLVSRTRGGEGVV